MPPRNGCSPFLFIHSLWTLALSLPSDPKDVFPHDKLPGAVLVVLLMEILSCHAQKRIFSFSFQLGVCWPVLCACCPSACICNMPLPFSVSPLYVCTAIRDSLFLGDPDPNLFFPSTLRSVQQSQRAGTNPPVSVASAGARISCSAKSKRKNH